CGVTIDARMDVKVLGIGADLPESVVLAGLAQTAKRHFVWPRMFRVKLRSAIPLRTDFEHKDVESLIDQNVRRDSTRRDCADDYCVINDDFLRHPYYPFVMLKSW